MKWNLALNFKWQLICIMIAIITFYSTHTLSLTTPPQNLVEGNLQLGFYDMMSQRKEIYDLHIKMVNAQTHITLTNPNDNRFFRKGMLYKVHQDNDKKFYSYRPIYHTTGHKILMVDEQIEMLMRMNVWLAQLHAGEQLVMIGQNGPVYPFPINNKRNPLK